MGVDADKEEGCTVSMYISNESAVVDVSADVCNGRKGCGDIRGIVYG